MQSGEVTGPGPGWRQWGAAEPVWKDSSPCRRTRRVRIAHCDSSGTSFRYRTSPPACTATGTPCSNSTRLPESAGTRSPGVTRPARFSGSAAESDTRSGVVSRDTTPDRVSLSAADPLNLAGLVTPGERVPALSGNRVLFEQGVPVAVQAGGEVRYLKDVPEESQWAIRTLLVRRQGLESFQTGSAAPH